MKYPNITEARFLCRPNRFTAKVMLDGQETVVHIKNTGRCRELLTEGAQVYLTKSDNLNRKTAYDLIAVTKSSQLVNIDSQAPNRVFYEWADSGRFLPNLTNIKPEYTLGDSRFDFFLEQGSQKHLVEVKGVTLEEDGVARFPDAPTERGVKHINGLIAAVEQGFTCWLCFVVQMKGVKRLEPNDRTHPAFGDALRRAVEAGVHILGMDCIVTADSLRIGESFPIRLDGYAEREGT